MKATISEQLDIVEVVLERARRALAGGDLKEAAGCACGAVMMIQDIKFPERYEDETKMPPDKRARVERLMQAVIAFGELGDDFLEKDFVDVPGSEYRHSTGMSRSRAETFINAAAAVIAAARGLGT